MGTGGISVALFEAGSRHLGSRLHRRLRLIDILGRAANRSIRSFDCHSPSATVPAAAVDDREHRQAHNAVEFAGCDDAWPSNAGFAADLPLASGDLGSSGNTIETNRAGRRDESILSFAKQRATDWRRHQNSSKSDPEPRSTVWRRVTRFLGNSSVASVMYLPPNTPSCSICFGVSSGLNSGSKFRPVGWLSV